MFLSIDQAKAEEMIFLKKNRYRSAKAGQGPGLQRQDRLWKAPYLYGKSGP